jgi:hypothetical protein
VIPFFKRFFRRRTGELPDPASLLKGAPVRARIKTYTSELGQTYRYVYRGYRESAGGRDFVFQILLQQSPREVGVRVLDSEVSVCSGILGRDFAPQERYAVAKMALFEAFDLGTANREAHFTPSASDMEKYLARLGRL